MNRVLLAILVILLCISGVEVVILFIQPHVKLQSVTRPPQTRTLMPTSTPFPAPTIAPHMTVKEIADTWNYVWLKGLTDTVMFTTSNKGTISNLEYTPDRNKPFDHEAQFDFQLNSLTDKNINFHFYYKPADVDKLTVTALKNGKEKKITIQDLKNGDKITLIVTANIFPEEGGKIQSMKIIKEE